MAGTKRKIEIFVEIENEKEFENIIKSNPNQLICVEVYSEAFGSCTVLDRLFTKIKLDWGDGQVILLKVPADYVDLLARFRQQSEPVYLFIANMRVTRVFRGVDNIRFAEVAKKELYHFRQDIQGLGVGRQTYEIDEPTQDEIEWLKSRLLEKEAERLCLSERRRERQAARKRHRAELMVPHLKNLNFVLFWPHCRHAHPELYERWDANNIIMVGREELELTEVKVADIFYEGDAPLNEASLHKLLSGPTLAICFRILDRDKHFVSLVRKILYEESYDESKTIAEHPPLKKTAFDIYKTFSPTREQIWHQRREEREKKQEEMKEKRTRMLSEMQRITRQAINEAIEAKRVAKEHLKLDLLKAGNLAALEELQDEPDDEEVDIVVLEELPDDEKESTTEDENDDEYFPPPGLLIPGFYSPPNDIAKVNGLAILFPKLVQERVTPEPEFLPPHVMVMIHIAKRYRAIDAIAPYKSAIIHMGIFKAVSPYESVHIAYTVKQYETLDISSSNSADLKLVFMLSVEVDIPLLELMDLYPLHVSRDPSIGEEECAAMFPVNYGDDYNEFEDFV